MKKVTVMKVDLLVKLRENRTAHRALFEKAQEAYRAEVIKQLDKALADAKAGRQFDTRFNIVPPIDQTQDYDRAIAMLEMDTGSEVELDTHEFDCYVLDRWAWKENVLLANTMYY